MALAYFFLIVALYEIYRQARSSLYANTQLRAHRCAEKKIKSKKNMEDRLLLDSNNSPMLFNLLKLKTMNQKIVMTNSNFISLFVSQILILSTGFFLLSISFLLGMFKKKPIAACTLFFIIIQDRPVE
jgi:hypothetical protein